MTLPPFLVRWSVRCLGAALPILGLAACSSMAPTYERPAVALAPAYSDVSDVLSASPTSSGSQAKSAQSLGWRDYFQDAGLQALIAQALAGNPDLRVAMLRIEEARAAYGIQRAEQFPEINADIGGTRSRTPADLNITQRPLLGNQFQVGAGLSWELDIWGRVRSLKDAALQSFLASDAAQRAATVSLVSEVANGYVALRSLDERITIARQTEESRRDSLRIFRRRVEVGATSRLDMLQVQTLWQQAQALLAQLEQSRASQTHALELLLGGPLPVALRQTPSAGASALLSGGLAAPISPGLPSDLLRQRPDVLAAEHQLRAANANIGAARAAFFPRIALTGSYGTASAELSGLFDSGSESWNFSPSISVPIFNAGRLRNSLSLSEVRRDIAVAQYEKTVQSAFRDVADALSAQRWLTQQVGVLEQMQAVQAERARLAALRYDNGAARYLEVLDAQRDELSAQQDVVQVRSALLSSQIGLYAALGGGQFERAANTDAASANSEYSENRP